MPGWLPPALIVLIGGVLVGALDTGRRRGQGARADDVHWCAGVFYYNRADKRILVPKRYGLRFGRTLNFAHPVAWIVVLAPLIVAAFGFTGRG